MSGKKENLIIPLPEEEVNLKPLRDAVIHYVNKVLENDGYPDENDGEHYIFGAAVKAIYGKDIFIKLNRINLEKYKKKKL